LPKRSIERALVYRRPHLLSSALNALR
jgi:hypothetical protein